MKTTKSNTELLARYLSTNIIFYYFYYYYLSTNLLSISIYLLFKICMLSINRMGKNNWKKKKIEKKINEKNDFTD